MLTPSQLATESTLRSVRNDLARWKRDDEDYACRLAMGSVAAVPVKSQFVTKTIMWFKPNQCKQDPGNVPIWNWLVKSWFQFINRSLTVPWVLLIMLSATSDHWPLTTHNTVQRCNPIRECRSALAKHQWCLSSRVTWYLIPGKWDFLTTS